MTDWRKRYMELAEMVASWSKDPSKKVGAVIVSIENNGIVSTGFNGFPAKCEDREERLNDRETKLLFTVHAEMNAILAARGANLRMCVMYSTLFPCANCMAAIAQSGIRTVVTYKPMYYNPSWEIHFEVARDIAKECGINLIEIKNDTNG